MDETNSPPTEGRAFSQVIDGLQKSYPRDKMEDISTSFCFICLLHLANEQGLKLESGSGEMNDEIDVGRRVGDIWGLKVSNFAQQLSRPSNSRILHRYIAIQRLHLLHNLRARPNHNAHDMRTDVIPSHI